MARRASSEHGRVEEDSPGQGSAITIYLTIDWLEVPLETLATVRAAVDVLVGLHVEADPEAPTAKLLPSNKVLVDGPAEETPASEHACDVGDCLRVFASRHALAVHKSRSHKGELANDSPSAPPAEASAEAAVLTYTCATCLETTTTYTALAEHTMGWHRRHPTTAERNGLEPDYQEPDDDPPEATDDQETPPAQKAYHCDDCEWTSQDGRDLFKHTGKEHGRQPYTWERQVRTAAERVA